MLDAQIFSYIFFTCERLKFESVLFHLSVKGEIGRTCKEFKREERRNAHMLSLIMLVIAVEG